MKTSNTKRGFAIIEFEDFYKQICSIQKSSLVIPCIWLGVDNTGPQLEDNNGQKNSAVGARMHLEKKQVEALIPILQYFVEHEDLPPRYNKTLNS